MLLVGSLNAWIVTLWMRVLLKMGKCLYLYFILFYLQGYFHSFNTMFFCIVTDFVQILLCDDLFRIILTKLTVTG